MQKHICALILNCREEDTNTVAVSADKFSHTKSCVCGCKIKQRHAGNPQCGVCCFCACAGRGRNRQGGLSHGRVVSNSVGNLCGDGELELWNASPRPDVTPQVAFSTVGQEHGR